jgi:chromosome segregation ATPase
MVHRNRRQAGVVFMIESIMFFGGGFLVAGLLALVLISFVHHRAVRLTQRRLEDAIPVSMAEIQADKDNLRAEFAMSARRLEMSVEQLKAKATNQLGDIARKTEAINRLKAELAEKTGVTDELDAKAKSLSGKILETEQEYAVKAAAVESTARALAAKEAELAKAANDISEQRLATDTQRVEIAVLKTQVEQFKSHVEELQQDAQDAARRLFDERVAVSTVTKELEEKRQAVDMLRPQVAQLEREIAAASSELEIRSRRIDELEAHVGERDRLLYQRATEISGLQQELAASKDAHIQTAERLNGEKSSLETLLATSNNTVESHSARIDDLEKWVVERDGLLSQRSAEAQALHQEIAAHKDAHSATAERMQGDKNALEALLQTANSGLEAHAGRILDLEGWVAERDGLLHQRDTDIQALFRQIATTKDEHNAVVAHLQTDQSSLETLLETAHSALEARAARISDLEGAVAERIGLLQQRNTEIKTLFQEIETVKDAHNAAVERVQADKGAVEKLLQTANHTLDTRAARIEDLESWVAERDGLLHRRDAEIKALFQEIATIKQETADATEQLRTEKAGVEGQLRSTLEDLSQTRIELTALNQEADATWRAERAENTLLRERISDIAAQVAHMAMAMDKSGSPIEAILTESASIRPEGFERIANGEGAAPPEGNLTDRIRKLQNGASRVSTAS